MRFKFRSPKRDESVDASRLSSIEKPLRSAIADVEREREGLAHRLKDARNQASMLMGTDLFEHRDREQAKEDKLSQSEQELVSAARRMRELDAQKVHLQRILEVLKQR